MRTSLKVKPYCFPQPVLMIASYNDDDTCNVMNAAWGNIIDFNKMAICMSASHKTVKNILKRKACSVSFATSKYVKEADYFGVVSGNDVQNKLEEVSMHFMKSETIDAPIIEELKLALECILDSYDEESEIMVLEIKNISVDDTILDQGEIDIFKLDPICYDSSKQQYITLGKVVGYAFKDGKTLIKS